MKVGSLVELVEEFLPHVILSNPNVVFPQTKKTYSVRDIRMGINILKERAFILLEEITNTPIDGIEPAFDSTQFRELLPPEEIAEALEEVNEVLKEREVLV